MRWRSMPKVANKVNGKEISPQRRRERRGKRDKDGNGFQNRHTRSNPKAVHPFSSLCVLCASAVNIQSFRHSTRIATIVWSSFGRTPAS